MVEKKQRYLRSRPLEQREIDKVDRLRSKHRVAVRPDFHGPRLPNIAPDRIVGRPEQFLWRSAKGHEVEADIVKSAVKPPAPLLRWRLDSDEQLALLERKLLDTRGRKLELVGSTITNPLEPAELCSRLPAFSWKCEGLNAEGKKGMARKSRV